MKRDILISVFTKFSSRFKANARIVLGNDADAEDALQDAFCRLWNSRTPISDEKSATSLSYTAVRNASIDMLRRRSTHPTERTDNFIEKSEEREDLTELFTDVRTLIENELSERDRQLLYKREMNGYEFSELADEYGLTESNVRVIVSRARRQIRDLYLKRKQS